MTCNEARSEIERDFLAKGNGSYTDNLRQHLMSCKKCRGHGASVAKVLQTVQLQKIELVPGEILASLSQFMATLKNKPQKKKRPLFWFFGATAIVLILAIVIWRWNTSQSAPLANEDTDEAPISSDGPGGKSKEDIKNFDPARRGNVLPNSNSPNLFGGKDRFSEISKNLQKNLKKQNQNLPAESGVDADVLENQSQENPTSTQQDDGLFQILQNLPGQKSAKLPKNKKPKRKTNPLQIPNTSHSPNQNQTAPLPTTKQLPQNLAKQNSNPHANNTPQEPSRKSDPQNQNDLNSQKSKSNDDSQDNNTPNTLLNFLNKHKKTPVDRVENPEAFRCSPATDLSQIPEAVLNDNPRLKFLQRLFADNPDLSANDLANMPGLNTLVDDQFDQLILNHLVGPNHKKKRLIIPFSALSGRGKIKNPTAADNQTGGQILSTARFTNNSAHDLAKRLLANQNQTSAILNPYENSSSENSSGNPSQKPSLLSRADSDDSNPEFEYCEEKPVSLVEF